MNITIAPSSFLENLRSATAQSHLNLEALPVSSSIMNPNVTAEEYLLYLSLMYDIVKDAEENIFRSLSTVITDLDERNKSNFLKSDLEFLVYQDTAQKFPLSGSLPGNSIAFSLGIMYVIEGSSLGGRVILKNISNTLGYDGDNGARYFTGYGGQTGSHWKRFLDMLQQYEAENNSSEEIIAGADYAFNAITRHFKNNTPQ